MTKGIVLIGLMAICAMVMGCGDDQADPEEQCQVEGGIVVTHTFTGNKWCDFPPFAHDLSDIGGFDYLIEQNWK